MSVLGVSCLSATVMPMYGVGIFNAVAASCKDDSVSTFTWVAKNDICFSKHLTGIRISAPEIIGKKQGSFPAECQFQCLLS